MSDGERVAKLLVRLYSLAVAAGWVWDAEAQVWVDPDGRRRDASERTQCRPVVFGTVGGVR